MSKPNEPTYRMDRLLTIPDLAQRLGVPTGTIRHWVLTRYIPFVKLGRRIHFDSQVVDEWIQHRAHPGRRAREAV